MSQISTIATQGDYAAFARAVYETGVISDAWFDGSERFAMRGLVLTPARARALMEASERVTYLHQELIADGSTVVVEVRDDGQGIDPALLPEIFDLFVQGERTVDRAAGGLGLGLALVRALVGMHGGRVEAASPGPGRGSTFTVRLKLIEPRLNQTQPGRAVSTPALSFETAANPRRILVVDDNEDARVLLVEALELSGHDVRGAADPVDALAVVDSFAPEIAFLDIGLPVMDGYELAIHLRSKLGEHPPLFVALTGYGQENDRVRSAESGFAAHLVKPVDIKRVLDTVDELSTPKPAGQ